MLGKTPFWVIYAGAVSFEIRITPSYGELGVWSTALA
jgi:hypothetical protein